MKRRRLGRSGLLVSEIGLGTMTFGSMADEATSFDILDRAFEAGVDFLDVAEVYPVPPDPKWAGVSEQIVGKWLSRKRREALVVATKIAGPSGGWFRAPVRAGRTGLDRFSIQRAVDGSLSRLRTDYIDLYQTHWPDPELPIEETLAGLEAVVRAGKVRAVGCSNESAYGLTKSLWKAELQGRLRYETIQNNFSLLNRRFDDELATVCRREGVSLLPYSPIAGGVLSGKYLGGAFPPGARFSHYREGDARTRAMTERFVNARTLEATTRFSEIAQQAGLPLTTLAISFTLSRDYVGSTLIGATHPDQLKETLGAAEVKLSPEALAACERIAREIPYPLG
ncbi:MAG TPA: aldo/keto reductase [Myxococcota bacterium]|nr:aldo/keto reductase [Myxococcota bacterium]